MGQNSVPNGYFYLPDLGAYGQAEMDTYNARMNATDEIIGNMWVNGQWNNNTITIGDGTAGNKSIYAYNEDANLPGIRYNDTSNVWEFTNDGVSWTAFASSPVSAITGTTADSFEINTDGFGLLIDTSGMSQDRTVDGEDIYQAIQHAQTTHDYAFISGNDAATDVTAAELETLSDGSVADALHTHTGLAIFHTLDDAYNDGNTITVDSSAVTLNGSILNVLLIDSSSNGSHIRLTGDPVVASPVDGDLWWTGVALNFYDGAVTHDLLAVVAPTLDAAYNGGNTIDVDGDPVTMTVGDGDNNRVLDIVQNDITNDPDAQQITNAGTGTGLKINMSGNGPHLNLLGDPTVAAPVDGDLWWTGTNLNFYDGAVTHDLIAAVSVTLDDAYNGGNTIDVDGSPVTLTVSDGDNNRVLDVVQNDSTNNPDAQQITNAGTGASLKVNSSGNGPHLNLLGDPVVAAPTDGDLWYTGSALNFRDGATTKDLLAAAGGGLFLVDRRTGGPGTPNESFTISQGYRYRLIWRHYQGVGGLHTMKARFNSDSTNKYLWVRSWISWNTVAWTFARGGTAAFPVPYIEVSNQPGTGSMEGSMEIGISLGNANYATVQNASTRDQISGEHLYSSGFYLGAAPVTSFQFWSAGTVVTWEFLLYRYAY